ncbi:unnamed protein product [Miscanthus lutarioriparius]|uniref:Reverse transcriptase domain-containing protein n=1 Tax=Miscanthus lutarioriparius TaxID=422564 RepID=A0A811S8Q7_9POAL|nr:unnamed protein product [Miscanthus lutarioriparius]
MSRSWPPFPPPSPSPISSDSKMPGLLNANFVPSVLSAWLQGPRCIDAVGNLAARLKSTRAAAKIGSRASPVAAYWKQRAKFRAVKEGDSNTAFFHAHAMARMRRNNIRCIAVNEVQVTSHSAKVQALTEHFRSVMGTAGQSNWQFDCNQLYQELTKATDMLTVPFTEDEARAAVKSMNQASAPGPDGFGPGFYKATWQTIKPDVMQFLSAFHDESVQLQRINRSYMVLIPKKPDANTTGFIRGRSITENFVYAMELVQCCRKRKVPSFIIKLDFAKAFDIVNWDALDMVLQARGFNSVWRRWMQSMQSSRTDVLVNGCPGPWMDCSTQIYTMIIVRELADVQNLRIILDQFADATGLQINYTKSTAVPIHMNGDTVRDCISALGYRREGFSQTYLGLPLTNGKLQLSAFAPNIAKGDRYLTGWQSSLLNKIGPCNIGQLRA